MLALIHSKQKEGWQPKKAIITTQTNPFFAQQEQGLIISPSREIDTASSAQHIDAKDLIRGIRNKEGY